DTTEDLSFLGDGGGRSFGQCVAIANGVDGPGPADLVAGAIDDPEQVGYNRGRVYVIANAFAPTAVPPPALSGVSFVGARPNPATGEVRLVFELERAVPVRVTVYDPAGREVARPIANETLDGRVSRAWRPSGLRAGVYSVRAQLGDREEIR